MESRMEGETGVLGENLPQRHFCPSPHPTWPDPGLNPCRRGGKPATNRLGYGAAELQCYDKDVQNLNNRPEESSTLKYKYFDIGNTQCCINVWLQYKS
jgi:hypothetical protein